MGAVARWGPADSTRPCGRGWSVGDHENALNTAQHETNAERKAERGQPLPSAPRTSERELVA